MEHKETDVHLGVEVRHCIDARVVVVIAGREHKISLDLHPFRHARNPPLVQPLVRVRPVSILVSVRVPDSLVSSQTESKRQIAVSLVGSDRARRYKQCCCKQKCGSPEESRPQRSGCNRHARRIIRHADQNLQYQFGVLSGWSAHNLICSDDPGNLARKNKKMGTKRLFTARFKCRCWRAAATNQMGGEQTGSPTRTLYLWKSVEV